MSLRFRETNHPSLYEINTRVWLKELAGPTGAKPRTLADVPDAAVGELAELGFDLVWLMGIWQGGEAGRALALQHSDEYRQALPDLAPQDILGSPYAVAAYQVSRQLGGSAALGELRRRLAKHGLGLILDFVPNHTARDHPWVSAHPEFYVPGSPERLAQEPDNFFLARTARGEQVIAHGRDPHFLGWSDTAQLNYRHPGMRAALIETLLDIAAQCDGVRCDMAMLLLEEVFSRTWGEAAIPPSGPVAVGEFWAEAIDAVRRRYPGFLFIAEVYWGQELALQALGFDYTYDKTLYDRLLNDGADAVRDHLGADLEQQSRAVRFLENHDEPRAAALLTPDKHRAAAVACYAAPGMRLFHEGQLDGWKVRLPVQLGRRLAEPADVELRDFYRRLLAALAHPALRLGRWRLLEAKPAWEGNSTWEQFLIQRWDAGGRGSRLAVSNLGPHQAQCYVPLDMSHVPGRTLILRDLLSEALYERDAAALRFPGLYLDLAPYQAHLFALSTKTGNSQGTPRPSSF